MPFKTSTVHTQHHHIERVIVTANMSYIVNVIELCIAIAVFYQKSLYICIALCSIFCTTLLNQKSSVKSSIFNK